MSSKSKKGQNRNEKFKPWKALVPFQVPPEAEVNGVVAAFQNHLVTIFIKETDAPAFPDPAGEPTKIAHLMLQWTRGLKGPDDFWYRMKQRAKNELCGEQAEWVELGPARWREQDSKQTHLWVLPQGATFPLGLVPKDIQAAMAEMAGGYENVVTKEDLEVFVVRHTANENNDEIIEVFASEDECKQMYGDKQIPDGATTGIELIGSVPAESQTAGWTDAAKVKVSNIIAKSREMKTPETAEAPELFYEHPTVEDDIWEDVDDDDPISLEEDLAIAGAMEEALKNRSEDRQQRIKVVSKKIIENDDTTSKIQVVKG